MRSWADVTQEDAARAAEATQSYISGIESGRIQPTLVKLSALLEKYRASAEYVLGQSDQWRLVPRDVSLERYDADVVEMLDLLGRMSSAHRSDLLGIARQFAHSSVEREQLKALLVEVERVGGEEARNSLLRFLGRFLPPDIAPGEEPDAPA